MISVVVPIYRCADCLGELYGRLVAALSAIGDDFEIILVNDGSPDLAGAMIAALAGADVRVRGVDLPRNLGQHAAIAVGLERCRGDWVVVMDGDLQDRPEEIARLHAAAGEGYDIVWARRARRYDARLRRLGSAAFYAVLRVVTGLPQDPSVANFGIYRNTVVAAIARLRQPLFFPLRVRMVSGGFRARSLVVECGARTRGKSAYDLRSLTRLAAEVIAAARRR